MKQPGLRRLKKKEDGKDFRIRQRHIEPAVIREVTEKQHKNSI